MLADLQRNIAILWAMGRLGFAMYMAYPAGVAMVFLSYPIIIATYRYLFGAIYSEGGTIGGYDHSGILTYVTVSWILNTLYMTPTGRALGAQVRDGQVAMDLLKPVNLMLLYFGQSIGRTAFRAIFASIPLLAAFMLLGGVKGPAPGSLILLAPAVLCGYLINFLLDYSIGLLAFYFEYNNGVRHAIRTVMNLVGGMVIPLSYFPEQISAVFKALPTQYMFYQPMQIYQGRVPLLEAWPLVAWGFGWVLALCLVAQLLQRGGARRMALSGG